MDNKYMAILSIAFVIMFVFNSGSIFADDSQMNDTNTDDIQEGESILVDSTPPEIESIEFSRSVVNDSYLDQLITINYNENMDIDVLPSIKLLEINKFHVTDKTYISTKTVEISVKIEDYNEDIEFVPIVVVGAKDKEGNEQVQYEQEEETFSVDTENPKMEVQVSRDRIRGKETQYFYFTFTEEMYEDVELQITFDEINSEDFKVTNQGWNEDHNSYKMQIDFGHSVEEDLKVHMNIVGFLDTHSNKLSKTRYTDLFIIDNTIPTVDISILNNSLNDNLLSQKISLSYSEDMDTSIEPTILIEDLLTDYNLTNTSGGGWLTNNVYTVNFNINDDNETNIANIIVSDAKDIAGNNQVENNTTSFEVDTNNAIATISFTENKLDNSNLTQRITLEFNKDMDTSIIPTLDINGLERTYTDFDNGTWENNRVFVTELTINDDDEENIATISLVSATDSNSNISNTVEDSFEVNTTNRRRDRPVIQEPQNEEPEEEVPQETNEEEETEQTPQDNENNSGSSGSTTPLDNQEPEDEEEPILDDIETSPVTGLVAGAPMSATKKVASGAGIFFGTFSLGLGAYKLFLLRR